MHRYRARTCDLQLAVAPTASHRLLSVVFACLWLSAPALGGELSAAHRALLEQLDNPRFTIRQQAMTILLGDPTVNDQTLAALLERSRSPEQRSRLLHIARHQFLRAYRLKTFKNEWAGSIGIRQQGLTAKQLPHINRPVVQVIHTLSGFPAHQVLWSGDLILAADSKAFRGHGGGDNIASRLANAIGTKRAGQTIGLTILRHGKMMDVQVALASRLALDRMYAGRARANPTGLVLHKGLARQWRVVHQQLLAMTPPRKTLTAAQKVTP